MHPENNAPRLEMTVQDIKREAGKVIVSIQFSRGATVLPPRGYGMTDDWLQKFDIDDFKVWAYKKGLEEIKIVEDRDLGFGKVSELKGKTIQLD